MDIVGSDSTSIVLRKKVSALTKIPRLEIIAFTVDLQQACSCEGTKAGVEEIVNIVAHVVGAPTFGHWVTFSAHYMHKWFVNKVESR